MFCPPAMATESTVWRWLLAVVLLVSKVQGECLVHNLQGSVRGIEMASRNGREFCSFRSIPFAAPPEGPLRFKDPVPIQSWTGEVNATVDVPTCVHGPLLGPGGPSGQEDCLYLNVYTPQKTFPSDKSLPVLVFFHGGSFEVGSSSSVTYSPKYFLDKDIVLVTTNYRLGLMGFLSTGDDEAPGNYGLKDQVAALGWIQLNIAEFGGDPNKVTIQGESAGGQSVHFHIFSSQSKGLFHGAISESGSAFKSEQLVMDNPLPLAQEQAKLVDCPVESTSVLVECLRNMDAYSLMETELVGKFRPVTEVKSALNPDPFIPALPLHMVQSGDFNRVPWMLGFNAEEGIIAFTGLIFNQAGLDKLNENFDAEAYTDLYLQLSLNDSLIPSVWQQIADFYLGNNHTITPDNVGEFVKLASDRIGIHLVYKAMKLHSKAGHSPLYLYNFGYRSQYSMVPNADYGNGPVNLGVSHADELIYLFNTLMTPERPEDHPDNGVIDALVTLWTNFATYGNPTPPDGDIPQGVVWQPANIKDEHVQYLKFGNADPPVPPVHGVMPLRISGEQDMYKERMNFWDSLPLYENAGQ